MSRIFLFLVKWLVAAPFALLGVPAAILLCLSDAVNPVWFLPMLLMWMIITGRLLDLVAYMDEQNELLDEDLQPVSR